LPQRNRRGCGENLGEQPVNSSGKGVTELGVEPVDPERRATGKLSNRNQKRGIKEVPPRKKKSKERF